jgi:hypothetical protein
MFEYVVCSLVFFHMHFTFLVFSFATLRLLKLKQIVTTSQQPLSVLLDEHALCHDHEVPALSNEHVVTVMRAHLSPDNVLYRNWPGSITGAHPFILALEGRPVRALLAAQFSKRINLGSPPTVGSTNQAFKDLLTELEKLPAFEHANPMPQEPAPLPVPPSLLAPLSQRVWDHAIHLTARECKWDQVCDFARWVDLEVYLRHAYEEVCGDLARARPITADEMSFIQTRFQQKLMPDGQIWLQSAGFLAGFAWFEAALRMIVAIGPIWIQSDGHGHPLVHGFLSSDDGAKRLLESLPGHFLLRLSEGQIGQLVLVFVAPAPHPPYDICKDLMQVSDHPTHRFQQFLSADPNRTAKLTLSECILTHPLLLYTWSGVPKECAFVNLQLAD